MSRYRQRGRAVTTVLISVVALVALLIGGAVGYAVHARLAGAPPAAPTAQAGEEDVWYTCGMHPQVLQKGFGECPICHMKLTPLKKDEGTEGEARQAGPTERKILYWRAPMDPGYVSDKPGKSPMGMDLVPVYADPAESAGGKAVRIDPVTIQNMGIRTARVTKGPLIKTIRTVGRLDYDERLVVFVNTKFSGWVEKLHVDYTGQEVRKGQPLFDVYSPELYVAQDEFVQAARYLPKMEKSSDTEAIRYARQNLESARVKLRYYDITDEQIDALAKSGTIAKVMTIYSPADGVVTKKMVLEGMYVKPGMELYTIADLSRIWAYADVYEYQLPWVKVGQKALMTLSYIPGEVFEGEVVYIYPYLQGTTRVIKVRLEFDNPKLRLKPEMYANVRIDARLKDSAVLVRREAYIDSGVRKLVFLDRGGGKFEPREVVTGVHAENDVVEVLQGLDEGDVIVTSGQFLIDAESKLREAVAKMMEARRVAEKKKSGAAVGESQVHEHVTGRHPAPAPMDVPPTLPPGVKYACPMDEHPDETDPSKQGPYFSDKPGKCPWCGMTLKPIEELAWARALRAAGGADVAYTCPDHQEVFSAEPGRCPRCGRDLEPFRVVYTCRDSEHAGQISLKQGECPQCRERMVPFRGPWLSEAMAQANVPPTTQPVAAARYVCPTHPLVHSDSPGRCTICARELAAKDREKAVAPATRPTFAKAPGKAAVGGFTCPMHPQVREATAGLCPICKMRLVPVATLSEPTTLPARIQRQVDFITEHYLELQRGLATDTTKDVASHALGIAAASQQALDHVRGDSTKTSPSLTEAIEAIRSSALSVTGHDLDRDRARFAGISKGFIDLLGMYHPDRKRWPKLYVFRCPMAKADWVQSTKDVANPYYGYKMQDCGELKAEK